MADIPFFILALSPSSIYSVIKIGIFIMVLSVTLTVVKRFMKSSETVRLPKNLSNLPSEDEILQKAKQNAENFTKK